MSAPTITIEHVENLYIMPSPCCDCDDCYDPGEGDELEYEDDDLDEGEDEEDGGEEDGILITPAAPMTITLVHSDTSVN